MTSHAGIGPATRETRSGAELLAELRRNLKLAPAKQKLARTIERFTAVMCEPHADGGARMFLVEWDGKDLRTLGQAQVPASGH